MAIPNTSFSLPSNSKLQQMIVHHQSMLVYHPADDVAGILRIVVGPNTRDGCLWCISVERWSWFPPGRRIIHDVSLMLVSVMLSSIWCSVRTDGCWLLSFRLQMIMANSSEDWLRKCYQWHSNKLHATLTDRWRAMCSTAQWQVATSSQGNAVGSEC